MAAAAEAVSLAPSRIAFPRHWPHACLTTVFPSARHHVSAQYVFVERMRLIGLFPLLSSVWLLGQISKARFSLFEQDF